MFSANFQTFNIFTLIIYSLGIYTKVWKRYLLVAFIFTSLMNCSKSAKEGVPKPLDADGCKIVRRVFESTSYDALGNITSSSGKWERKHTLNEKLAPVETDESYQYLEGGRLLIKRNHHTAYHYNAEDLVTNVKIIGKYTFWRSMEYVTSNDTTSNFYKYQNNKLSEESVGNGSITSSYEYGTDGQLNKFISSDSRENQVTRTYMDGVLASIVESKPLPDVKITYNNMGFIETAKYSDIALEYKYSYDKEGNLLKRESYSNNILQSYSLYINDAPNLQSKAGIIFKGHPTIPSTLGSGTKLLKQVNTFSTQVNGSDFIKTAQSDCVYEFNATGYYTSLAIEAITYKMDGQIAGRTKSLETLVYQNCK